MQQIRSLLRTSAITAPHEKYIHRYLGHYSTLGQYRYVCEPLQP